MERTARTTRRSRPESSASAASIGGKVDKRLRFQLNFARTPLGEARSVDAFGMLELHESANVWAGRFIPPGDRASLSGPFFQSTWEPPFVASLYPTVAAGRDDGVAAWGQWRGGKVKVYTFDGELVWRGDLFESLRLVATPETSAKLLLAIPQGNKAQVRRFFEQVNRGNAGIVDEILARNFEQHSQMPMAPGREGLKAFYAEMWKAFPGAQFTIEDMVAEGDRVVVRMTARYVHKGDFMGVAPTGKAVEIQKMDVFRFAGGRCVEHWDVVDRLGLLQQLGALPKLPRWSTTPGYEQIR